MTPEQRGAAPKRRLSEAEAWREIARRIAEGETPMRHGICYEASCLDEIDEDTYSAMHAAASHHAELSPDRWRYLEPCGWFAFREGTEKEGRILACLWLALEAESDAHVSDTGSQK